MDENAFPQDTALGTDTNDWDDAAQFAQLGYAPHNVDYVVEGLQFNVNWSTNTLNVGEGVAKLSQGQMMTKDHTNNGGPPQKAILHGVMTVQTGPSGDMALADGSINHVFLSVDHQTNDRVQFSTNVTADAPGEPSLKIGEVDTAADQFQHTNRAPAARLRSFEIVEPAPDS